MLDTQAFDTMVIVMSVRAVFFDLGDTLIFQAHEPGRERLVAAMTAQARPLLQSWGAAPGVDLTSLLGELHDAVAAAQPLRRAAGLEVDGPFITQGALAAYGIDATTGQARALFAAIAVDPATWGWQTYPDTIDTLQRLRSTSTPVAIVSNGWYTSDVQSARMERLGIRRDLYEAFVTSADVMHPKPHPASFQRALDALGVDAGEAIFVGDDPHADVRGAKALGMSTVWKLNGRYEVPPAQDADYTIHDLWELFTLGVLPQQAEAELPLESLTPHEDDNAGRY